MKYLRSYQFVFESPTWTTTMLVGIVCSLVPVVGPLVFLGYGFEIIEAMQKRGDKGFPEFDMNRLTNYLMRGLWPFLMNLIVGLPIALLIVGMVLTLILGAIAMEFKGAALLVVVFGVIALEIILLMFMSVIILPLMLRSGLSLELAFGESWKFLKDFLGRVGKEVIWTILFLNGSGLVLALVGVALCYIGIFPAQVLIMLAQFHLMYQLYALYLERGGEPVPIKVEAVP